MPGLATRKLGWMSSGMRWSPRFAGIIIERRVLCPALRESLRELDQAGSRPSSIGREGAGPRGEKHEQKYARVFRWPRVSIDSSTAPLFRDLPTPRPFDAPPVSLWREWREIHAQK